ncbi:hypothetical protein EHEL_100460 [Encephalitozoon hellem ATCC 50504]|uniref:Mechanosensitive channel protein n=1 Tax=Encephalitozoon hellem TaxID=27973 RepID=A0A9Q9C4P8_ENCHE|nr:uncharacterized protein EHEL_100460 [Encephalitozoon hellem ATCC 50504]AFM99140.2 hypothetical protein EHEL_100460 [Encephalitozoon hellem ATCC 50504]UTX44126.1 mechanosensitive channel protein [Encephalitozoon hellem]WEL39615.1 mechanosensitive ion channel protein [Encephalitozoon hellem]
MPPGGTDPKKEVPQEEKKEGSKDGKEEEKKESSQEEKVEGEKKKEEKKDDGVIDDIIANNAVDAPPVEPQEEIMFTKAKVFEEEELSFWNIDSYLHSRFSYIPETARRLIEITIVVILFMMFPIILAFLENGEDAIYLPVQVIQNTGTGPTYLFFRINLFISMCYVIYVAVSLFASNILYIIIWVLNLFNYELDEYAIEIIQVINSTSWCWKQSLIALLVFFSASITSQPYSFGQNDGSYKYKIITMILMYSVFISVVFIEKFFMCFMISEIRRKEYRNRIWDINYKTFVFKKLAAISEASPSERKELAETIQPEFDPGFYLKYNDLKLNSMKGAETVAESIFGFLEVRSIIYQDLEKFFPDNHDEVYAYLAESSETKEKNNPPPITFEDLKAKAVALYKERTDISRTLQSRDIVINKLDIILVAIAMYFGAILVMILLGINYSGILATILPSIVTFSWIFSDTIKEIYNCFIFLLVNHPYDCGDRVVIDGEELYVSSVDLLSSTFTGVNGRQVFIPTSTLFRTKIHNIRRSGKQFSEVGILVSKMTSFDTALKLKDGITKAISESTKSFSGEIYIREFKAEGDNVKIVFAIQHQTNFQDIKKKHDRRVEIVNILEREMKAQKIEYRNSYTFSD